MIIRGSVGIYPTEDQEKVKDSVLNIFPGAQMEMEEETVHFISDDPSVFIECISSRMIRDAAVMVLTGSLRDDTAHFHLNKQAAFMGRVNFTDGDSSLGDIDITVDDAKKFVKMISEDSI